MYIRSLLPFSFCCWAAVSAATPILEERASPASSTDYNELVRAAKLSSVAYVSCSRAFDVTITYTIDNTETDTQGYIGYSQSLKRITVAMRGSTSAKDFENDANTDLVSPTLSGVAFPKGVLIMEGIYSPWSSVHSEVIAEVRRLTNLYPSYTLETTGHSLGGALTYMSYIALAQNFPTKSITSNALAAFSIGNKAFADFGAAQNGVLRRGNNKDDGVPNVYPDFVHYGVEYYGSGTLASTVRCSGSYDQACSAGNGQTGITDSHSTSFGVRLGYAGCS